MHLYISLIGVAVLLLVQAIGALNGFSIAGKHLKVSFKKKKQGGLQPGTE